MQSLNLTLKILFCTLTSKFSSSNVSDFGLSICSKFLRLSIVAAIWQGAWKISLSFEAFWSAFRDCIYLLFIVVDVGQPI